MHSREKNRLIPFPRVLILLSLLIVVFLFYSRITTRDFRLVFPVSSTVSSSFRNLKEFSDEQKLSYKKSAAGYWIYQTEDSTAPFRSWTELNWWTTG